MTRRTRAVIAGFTMIELMVVAFIIGVIMGIAIPMYISSRQVAQREACRATRRKIDQELIIFTSDTQHTPVHINELLNSGYLPPVSCPAGGTFELRLRADAPPESEFYHPAPYVWCSVHGSDVESEEDDDDDVPAIQPVVAPVAAPVQLNP